MTILFDFDDNDQLYIYSSGAYEYKMPFTLMLDLKRYVRTADLDMELLLIVKEWYLQLERMKKEKVIIMYNQVKIIP